MAVGNNSGGEFQLILSATIDVDKTTKNLNRDLKKVANKTDIKLNVKDEPVKKATKNVNSLTGSITKNIAKVIEWAAATGLVYTAFNELKEGVQFIKDLNTEMTNISVYQTYYAFNWKSSRSHD